MPPATSQGYVLFLTTIQREPNQHRGPIISASEPDPILVTESYEIALQTLYERRKDITSRQSTAEFAFCMWRSKGDGVDVILVLRTGELTTEVRLRIRSVEISIETLVVAGRHQNDGQS